MSVSQPMTGESAYIPAMCSEMVNPIRTRTSVLAAWVWPAGMSAMGPSVSNCRCRGVIDITAAMQPWAAMIARRASRARGEAWMARMP